MHERVGKAITVLFVCLLFMVFTFFNLGGSFPSVYHLITEIFTPTGEPIATPDGKINSSHIKIVSDLDMRGHAIKNVGELCIGGECKKEWPKTHYVNYHSEYYLPLTQSSDRLILREDVSPVEVVRGTVFRGVVYDGTGVFYFGDLSERINLAEKLQSSKAFKTSNIYDADLSTYAYSQECNGRYNTVVAQWDLGGVYDGWIYAKVSAVTITGDFSSTGVYIQVSRDGLNWETVASHWKRGDGATSGNPESVKYLSVRYIRWLMSCFCWARSSPKTCYTKVYEIDFIPGNNYSVPYYKDVKVTNPSTKVPLAFFYDGSSAISYSVFKLVPTIPTTCDPRPYYCDKDRDGHVSRAPYGTSTVCLEDFLPTGCTFIRGDDCDDTNRNVHPGAHGPCGSADGIDNDCDGSVDEDGIPCVYGDYRVYKFAWAGETCAGICSEKGYTGCKLGAYLWKCYSDDHCQSHLGDTDFFDATLYTDTFGCNDQISGFGICGPIGSFGKACSKYSGAISYQYNGVVCVCGYSSFTKD